MPAVHWKQAPMPLVNGETTVEVNWVVGCDEPHFRCSVFIPGRCAERLKVYPVDIGLSEDSLKLVVEQDKLDDVTRVVFIEAKVICNVALRLGLDPTNWQVIHTECA